MKLSKIAFIGSQIIARGTSFSARVPACSLRQPTSPFFLAHETTVGQSRSTATRLFATREEATLTNIGKEQMEEIVEDYEEGGREDSGYVIMDVREEHEIALTGKLSPNTITFPLGKIAQYDAFSLEADEFEEVFGFEKPALDETLVFSCAAGIRSVHAARFAAQHGYTKLVNYMGGAHEWFH